MANKKTIFQLGSDYVELNELLEDDEITDEEFAERLAKLDCDTDEKIERYLEIANEFKTRGEAKVAYAKAAEERIKMKKKNGESDINKSERMKAMVLSVLKVRGERKYKGKLFNATIKSTAPSVEYDDIKDIPEEFLIPQDAKVDTKALKEMLKKKEEAGETCDFARLKKSEYLYVS